MTNREIETSIKQAFINAVPDVFDSILADCSEQEGGVIVMTEIKKSNKWVKRAIGIAAALVVVAGGLFGFNTYKINYTVDSTISLDVNPSIEIQVNQKERVLDVIPLNDDGRVVLGDMNLKGSDLEVSINALIGSMLRNGYLNDIANSILVSVDNNDPTKGEELQMRLAEEINNLLQTNTFTGAVLSQTIKQDNDTQTLAGQYGITLGKAQLIQQIVSQDARYSFEDLVPLSINELNLISGSGNTHLNDVASVGTASDKGYIGEDSAKEAALKHAGVNASDIRNYESEMDYEQGKMVYEIEFACGGYEYDYDIDAASGEVLRHRKEVDDDYVSTGSGGSGGSANTGGGAGTGSGNSDNANTGTSYIGEDSAKNAAYSHAGVSASDVREVKCELDWDNGRYIYEVDFYCGGYEYDYDIDATGGEVLRHRKEVDDDYVSTGSGDSGGSANTGGGAGTGSGSSGNANTGTSYIGEDSAKNAAYSHAGVSAPDVRKVKCELDWDDGRAIYEVGFDCNGYEYSYEIDAYSGAVLDYDIDD